MLHVYNYHYKRCTNSYYMDGHNKKFDNYIYVRESNRDLLVTKTYKEDVNELQDCWHIFSIYTGL